MPEKKVKDTFKKNTKLEVNEPLGGVGFKNHWFAAKYHLANIHGIRFPKQISIESTKSKPLDLYYPKNEEA